MGDCLGTHGASGMGLNLGSKLEYGRFKIKLLTTNYTKQGISSDLVILSKEFCLVSALKKMTHMVHAFQSITGNHIGLSFNLFPNSIKSTLENGFVQFKQNKTIS